MAIVPESTRQEWRTAAATWLYWARVAKHWNGDASLCSYFAYLARSCARKARAITPEPR